jgi:hypothetical protein
MVMARNSGVMLAQTLKPNMFTPAKAFLCTAFFKKQNYIVIGNL